ncbi:MAG: hypothetical protein J6C40_05770, partial [Lentisphaeria bacterium]|nr:hypothetical protein [Lentisphaeria bacterium]
NKKKVTRKEKIMKRNSLKQRNIINIMRSYGETQVLTTNSSIRVNGIGRERETFWEKGPPFLPRTPSILSKNFRVITFFASAKTVIVFFTVDLIEAEICFLIIPDAFPDFFRRSEKLFF